MENTVDGKQFVTARGWEDLSELLKVYRMLGKKADREVVHQYLQNWEVAKEFANYMELYEKYKKDYGLEKIVQGVYSKETLEKLRFASFDERFSIVGMLSGKLCEFRAYCVEDEKTARLYDATEKLQRKRRIWRQSSEKDGKTILQRSVRIFYQEKQRNWRGQFWKNWNPIAVSGN